jgi:hypothetical protein
MPVTRKRVRDLETSFVGLVEALCDEVSDPLRGLLLDVDKVLEEEEEEEEDGVVVAARNLRLAIEDVYAQPLRAPRLRRLYIAELPTTTVWKFYRRERYDVAIMRILGVPLVVYDALCDHAREFLGPFDPTVPRPGPDTRLDYFDVIAITLRRLQVCGPKWLEILELEFGATASVVWRALDAGTTALVRVLRKLPGAAVRYCTQEEMDEAWRGFVAQHGEPPWAEKHTDGPFKGQYKWPEIAHVRLGRAMDGTVTPAFKAGNKDEEKLLNSGNKGHCFNHVFTTCIAGVVEDYSACVVGVYTDSRTSAVQLETAMEPTRNPTSDYALVLDNGWRRPICFPLPNAYAHMRAYKKGQTIVMRPLREGDCAPKGLLKYFQRASAYITVFRQHGEHLNGGVKQQFPALLNPVRSDLILHLRITFELVRDS